MPVSDGGEPGMGHAHRGLRQYAPEGLCQPGACLHETCLLQCLCWPGKARRLGKAFWTTTVRQVWEAAEILMAAQGNLSANLAIFHF